MLSEREALEKSIVMWKELAETGAAQKPHTEPQTINDCYLCHYAVQQQEGRSSPSYPPCPPCPLYKEGLECMDNKSPYNKWTNAKTPRSRKYYARVFLAQLTALYDKLYPAPTLEPSRSMIEPTYMHSKEGADFIVADVFINQDGTERFEVSLKWLKAAGFKGQMVISEGTFGLKPIAIFPVE